MAINKDPKIWDRSQMNWQDSSDDDHNWRGLGEYGGYEAPRILFPLYAAAFVFGAGFLSVIFFRAGMIALGAIFSLVVAAGLYVLWNNVQKWRAYWRRRATLNRS